MENASKALVIAGAVLISILLIGVGVLIYNSAMKPIEEAGSQMDAQAISMFNSKFDSYVGNKVNASSVRSLISQVTASNASSPNQVALTGVTSLNAVQQTKTYTVTPTYGTEAAGNAGLIVSIDIKAN